jgi:hypothetical protein
MPMTGKSAVSPTDMEDTAALAQANRDAGFKRLSTFESVLTFMSMKWLGVGGKVLTADLQANLKDNCINGALARTRRSSWRTF